MEACIENLLSHVGDLWIAASGGLPCDDLEYRLQIAHRIEHRRRWIRLFAPLYFLMSRGVGPIGIDEATKEHPSTKFENGVHIL